MAPAALGFASWQRALVSRAGQSYAIEVEAERSGEHTLKIVTQDLRGTKELKLPLSGQASRPVPLCRFPAPIPPHPTILLPRALHSHMPTRGHPWAPRRERFGADQHGGFPPNTPVHARCALSADVRTLPHATSPSTPAVFRTFALRVAIPFDRMCPRTMATAVRAYAAPHWSRAGRDRASW